VPVAGSRVYALVVSGVAVESTQAVEEEWSGGSFGHWALARRRFFRNRLAVVGLFILGVLFTVGFLARQIAPYGYLELDLSSLAEGPSSAHLFGTDQLGRDYFSRVILGIGTEATIALLVGFFGTLIGTLLGAVAGYFGGAVDNLVMRMTDLLLTLPPLLVLLVAASNLHTTTVLWVSVLMGCVLWMPMARIVRARCLSLRDQAYVDAARAIGASDVRIIARHILPNAIGSVAVAATVMTAGAILLETTISYLGFGLSNFSRNDARTSARTPSLGDVIYVAKDEGLTHWWGTTFAGLAIILIVASIYFIGDGLRDALDPIERHHVTPAPRRRKRRRPLPTAKLLAAVPRPELPALPVAQLETALRVSVAWIPRRRARRRTAVRLLIETVVILLATAGTAAAVYAWKVRPVSSQWPVAGTLVQNVSRAVGAQTEISVALAPGASRVLFAASNDTLMRTIRVHTSTDGGRTWSSSAGPSLGSAACARGDPAAAIAPDGHEYVAFTVNPSCNDEDPEPYLVVASNAGPRTPWTVRRVVAATNRFAWDDKPALAAGPDGRVHVVWSRLVGSLSETTVISTSSDRGRSWSPPRSISGRLVWPQLASIAAGADRALYVAGVDAHLGIWVARSDGRGHFIVRHVAPLPGNEAATCVAGSEHPIPGQANRCLGPDPTVTATRDRVYVTYGLPITRLQRVFVAVLDRDLHVLLRHRIAPSARMKGDQFWPVSAVDGSTRDLWACFYDTSGDSSRREAWFVCTVSHDGRHWARPVRASPVSSSTEVLWEDGRIFGFLDHIGYGGYPGLAVGGGVAHPMWVDTRDLAANKQEVFAARIAASAMRP
jgi:peptide/nickel transport system permease protein